MGIYEKKIKKSTHKHIYYSYPHTCKIINKIEQSLDLQIKPQDRFKRLKKKIKIQLIICKITTLLNEFIKDQLLLWSRRDKMNKG